MATHTAGNGPDAESLLDRVNAALASQASEVVFSIGGSIDVSAPDDAAGKQQHPLTIRYDSREKEHGLKVELPVHIDDPSEQAFQQLVTDCEPATFGQGEKEIFDEQYRKAGKLDASKFCTSFNPYEHGVMDIVTQALVHTKYHGIRAELYNLNIYSGPSGKFKPHVDTPRSEKQMGSLVVCLPHPHQGGQLAVRHGGREVVFDWAAELEKNPSKVQWAAFFSDCEHEVLEVTGGHRLTMTYNLYWTPQGPSLMASHLDALEPQSLHFFSALRKLLECPEVLKKGGAIGFECTHAYPLTSSTIGEDLEKGLKGLDMLVYQALKHLAKSVRVVAMLDDEECNEDMRMYSGRPEPESKAPTGKVGGAKALLGNAPHSPLLWDNYEDNGDNGAEGSRVYGHYRRRKVTWLNGPSSKELSKEFAIACLTYGNEPGIDACYSSAVIMAELSEQEK